MTNKINIPQTFMGVDGREALERILSGIPVVNAQDTSTLSPGPATNVDNPSKYIILEGRTHGKYSYPDLLVAMDKSHHGRNWKDSHLALAQEGNFMLGIRQFVDFLNHLRTGRAFDGNGHLIDAGRIEAILNDIYKVGGQWRSEWLDADFKVLDKTLVVFGGKIAMNYEHRLVNGNLIPIRANEVLDGYLDKNKQPGLDIKDWLTRATYQGLPPIDIANGSLYYWSPGKDNNAVARFYAYSDWTYLDCDWDPSYRNSQLGVRAAREKN